MKTLFVLSTVCFKGLPAAGKQPLSNYIANDTGRDLWRWWVQASSQGQTNCEVGSDCSGLQICGFPKIPEKKVEADFTISLSSFFYTSYSAEIPMIAICDGFPLSLWYIIRSTQLSFLYCVLQVVENCN